MEQKSPLEPCLLHLNPATRLGKQNGARQEEQPSPRCCWQLQGCHTSPGIPTLVTMQPEGDRDAPCQGSLQLNAPSTGTSAALTLSQGQKGPSLCPRPSLEEVPGQSGHHRHLPSYRSMPAIPQRKSLTLPSPTLDSAELLCSLGREPQLWDWGGS